MLSDERTLQHLNPFIVRFIPHRQCCSPTNGRCRVVTCPRGSPKSPLDLTHQRLRVSREQHVPDSSAFALPGKAVQRPLPWGKLRKTDRHRHRHRDTDSDTDTEKKRRQQSKFRDNEHRLNVTHMTHVGLCGYCFKTVPTRPCMFSETAKMRSEIVHGF